MEFKPHLTPVEMFKRGVFGGSYFEMATSDDFAGLDHQTAVFARANCRPFNKDVNDYGVRAGEDFASWMKNGWIFPEDPLGWFHWYCRYSAGRRHERDAHQIARWAAYGARWGRYARTQAHVNGDASSVVKQGLLQWAYEPMTIIHGV